jgi:carboxymethylenebutenolidase
MAAARLAGFSCAIPYYGGGILDAAGERPQCPVMAHFGERDAVIPVAGVRKLAADHPEAQVFTTPTTGSLAITGRHTTHRPAARERTLRSCTSTR